MTHGDAALAAESVVYTAHLDHVGITVSDLDAALDFFVGLGLEVEGRMDMEGEFVDTVTGIPSGPEIPWSRTAGSAADRKSVV